MLFREWGACIHSFAQRVPAFAVPDTSEWATPLTKAFVHPIDIVTPADPRAHGQQVSGYVKWVNDALDTSQCLSETFPDAALANDVKQIHLKNVSSMRTIESQQLDRNMGFAACHPGPPDTPNADKWGTKEEGALETMLQTLDVLSFGYSDLDVVNSNGHGKFTAHQQVADVLVMRAETHEDCLEYTHKKFICPLRHRLFLVSRDRENRGRLAKETKIYSAVGATPGEEIRITEPESSITSIAFSDLQDLFIGNSTPSQLETALHAKLF